MKKKVMSAYLRSRKLKKLLLTMKLTIAILLVSLMQVSATVYSQTTKFSFRTENKQIAEVLKEIEESSKFRFFYIREQVNVERLVSVNANEATVQDILDRMFINEGISYEIREDFLILLSPENRNSEKVYTSAQQKSITGKVSDEVGQALPGVTVVIKGTTNGTITDMDGNYSISNLPENATLVFSFVGMKSQEMMVGSQTTIDIILVNDAIGIEEVVAIGYGTLKKSDITGAVASVSKDMLESRPISTFEDALKGRTSGVQIRQTGGDLAGDFSISIRGIGSVTGSNDPLIVVDNVPLFSSNFSTINPKDIESIDILKDASATAIYGSRAANGVIIISTKKGQKGKPRLTLDVDMGFEQIANRYDVLSTEQQRLLFVEAFTNSNRSTAVYDDPTDPAWQVDTDWQDIGTRTALRQNYNLGFSGGSEKTDYSGSLSYLNREGTLLNSDLQSYSLRLNVNSEFNKWLKLSTNLTGSHQKQNVVINDSWGSSGFRSLAYQHSYTEPYDDNGELTAVNTTAAPYFGANDNPLVNILLPTRESNVSRILGNSKLDVTLTDGLVLSGNFGADIVLGDGYTYLPVYSIGRFSRAEGSVTVPTSQQINWVGDITLDYAKQFGKHDVKALAGFSAQQFHITSASVTGTGTIDNGLNQLSNQTDFSASGSDISSGLVSSFARVNYNYDNKYLLTGTVRRDGSSKFGSSNRYGIFPSGSFAWRVSQESFLKSSKLINDLKLRVSYGLTGNQNIGDFAFITKAGAASYVFGNSTVVGNAPLNIGNPDLKWEATVQFNAGMDISLFDGRIYSTIDFYNKESQDLLVSTPIPLTSGVAVDPIVNLGSVKNTGLEFAVNTRNIEGVFSWNTNFNISFNKNEVIDIGTNSQGNPLEIPGANIPLSNQMANLTIAGHPAASFYMYTFDGVWQLGEEVEAAAWNGASPGDPKYADLNDNGKWDAGDKSIVGSPHPKYFGGIDNTFTYKSLSLSILAEFAGGFKVYNTARNLLARGVPFVQNFAEVADFWTTDNPSNTVPRPSQGGYTTTMVTMVSTRWLEDGDYLKIKNIKLSYQLPSEIFNSGFVQSARVSLTGTNLLTFTKYTGLDPEASSSSSLLSAGIDYTPYPPTRLVSVAVQINF
jgi:TonB-linked SusC/RagA family outer membrane protein